MPEELAVEALRLRYEIANRIILDDVDLEVRKSSSTAIVGPSGTGKTTLLMCLAGIIEPTSGVVRVDGEELTAMRSAARAAVRLRRIGLIYQFGELLPELSPLDNVALPALLAGVRHRSAYARARLLLAEIGAQALADAPTASLSGGERQRVAVARALVTEPDVVLADEPTGSLDPTSTEVVANMLFDLPQKYGCALIVVTHNDHVAARADNVLSLGLKGDGARVGIG